MLAWYAPEAGPWSPPAGSYTEATSQNASCHQGIVVLSEHLLVFWGFAQCSDDGAQCKVEQSGNPAAKTPLEPVHQAWPHEVPTIGAELLVMVGMRRQTLRVSWTSAVRIPHKQTKAALD